MSPVQRRLAYQADVTYGTAKEFGFDFLRDRLAVRRRSQTTAEDIAAADRRGVGRNPAATTETGRCNVRLMPC